MSPVEKGNYWWQGKCSVTLRVGGIGIGTIPKRLFSSKVQVSFLLGLVFLMVHPSISATVTAEDLRTSSTPSPSSQQEEEVYYQSGSVPMPNFPSELLSLTASSEEEEEVLRPSNSKEKRHFSRALDRIHFGPFYRIRSPVINRASFPNKFASSSFENGKPPPPSAQEKKALSFFSRFYPGLQHGGGGGSSPYSSGPGSESFSLNGRRIPFPYSPYTASGEAPVGRSSRPIMRLRWGK